MSNSIDSSKVVAQEPRRIHPREHPLSADKISPAARQVLHILDAGGFAAFLVGGCVRDILLGLEPKDFDVATNARPDEIKRLFRRCRLVGRRFRLAHVSVGREIIEVATFRAAASSEISDTDTLVLGSEGQLLRDNIYGDIHDDVWRRDFTANALYYNFSDGSLWDYVDGVKDIRTRVLRLIGDPERRFREDPVRMLRAARFAGKLQFSIAPETRQAILAHGRLLSESSPARLFDELLKLFHTGSAVDADRHLQELKLFPVLFPVTAAAARWSESRYQQMWKHSLVNTDERVRAEKSVTPAFMLAVVLWCPIREKADEYEAKGTSPVEALLLAAHDVIREQDRQIAIPRRFAIGVKEMISMQPRFTNTRGRRVFRLLAHPRFRAAYDFFMLRSEAGDADKELAKWWTKIQTCSQSEQQKMVDLDRRDGRTPPPNAPPQTGKGEGGV